MSEVSQNEVDLLIKPPVSANAAVLGEMGDLQVRLAQTAQEIEALQRLRQRIFRNDETGRDEDPFDAVCDHLIVIDRAAIHESGDAGSGKIVGTYRMLRDDVADAGSGFYSAKEFDIPHLRQAYAGKRLLELGRSCVLEPYRNRRTVELLWQGVWAYVIAHKIDLMFGCASFDGTNPIEHAEALSFLHAQCLASPEIGTSALPHLRQRMNLLPADQVNARRAFRALPPLMKGYVRLGARIGDGAVIDHEFATTDVLIILPVANLNPRYVAHYGADASRYAPEDVDRRPL